MADERLLGALRSLQPDMDALSVDRALVEVELRTRRRRQRRGAGLVAAAAAAVLLVVGIVATIDDPSSEQSVVVDTPTSTTPGPTATVVPTTTTSAEPDDPVVATVDDLSDGIASLELHTWTLPADPWWRGLWRADTGTAVAIAAALQNEDDVPRPEQHDLAYMRFELPGGRIVPAVIDLESGWVAGVDTTGRPDATGGKVHADIARGIRSSFNDAVGTPWRGVAPSEPHLADLITRAGFPLTDLDGASAEIRNALQTSEQSEFPVWYVDVDIDGPEPFVILRSRGLGDDSARGVDYRLALVETPDGWQVSSATSRALCTRSNPTPEQPLCV